MFRDVIASVYCCIDIHLVPGDANVDNIMALNNLRNFRGFCCITTYKSYYRYNRQVALKIHTTDRMKTNRNLTPQL